MGTSIENQNSKVEIVLLYLQSVCLRLKGTTSDSFCEIEKKHEMLSKGILRI